MRHLKPLQSLRMSLILMFFCQFWCFDAVLLQVPSRIPGYGGPFHLVAQMRFSVKDTSLCFKPHTYQTHQTPNVRDG